MPVARRDVIGLPAYAQATGAAVGRVAEVLCGRDVAHVIGLLLEGRGRRRRVVPFEEVATIGPTAVLLKNPVVLPAGEGPRLREVRRRTAAVVGRRVLAADGHEVGVIDDLVFDGGNGLVLGFLVSGGLIQDLLQGQDFLPASDDLGWRAQAVVLGEAPQAPPTPGGPDAVDGRAVRTQAERPAQVGPDGGYAAPAPVALPAAPGTPRGRRAAAVRTGNAPGRVATDAAAPPRGAAAGSCQTAARAAGGSGSHGAPRADQGAARGERAP